MRSPDPLQIHFFKFRMDNIWHSFESHSTHTCWLLWQHQLYISLANDLHVTSAAPLPAPLRLPTFLLIFIIISSAWMYYPLFEPCLFCSCKLWLIIWNGKGKGLHCTLLAEFQVYFKFRTGKYLTFIWCQFCLGNDLLFFQPSSNIDFMNYFSVMISISFKLLISLMFWAEFNPILFSLMFKFTRSESHLKDNVHCTCQNATNQIVLEDKIFEIFEWASLNLVFYLCSLFNSF